MWKILKGDGITDDLDAFKKALSSQDNIFVPKGRYYLGDTLIIPNGKSLFSFPPCGTNPPSGTVLLFLASLAKCVQIGIGTSYESGIFDGFIIERNGIYVDKTIVPEDSIGLECNNTMGAIVRNVYIIGHAIGLKSNWGITNWFEHISTTCCKKYYVEIDTTPECRFLSCRFGQNGSTDVQGQAYICATGGDTDNISNGPNTIIFNNCHFNLGGGVSLEKWFDVSKITSGHVSEIDTFQFDNCYIESVNIGLYADETVNSISFLQMNNYIVLSNKDFWGVNALTIIDNVQMSNCLIKSNFSINTNKQINFLNISNVTVFGKFTLNTPSIGEEINSVVNVSNIYAYQGITLDGKYALLTFNGNSAAGYSNNAIISGISLKI
ncbi:hypothetical protein [Zymomonas mobilis]|uniref:Pectate lyase superfamily protein domain-containing protein n=1 Tax=Zymomonas mobilis subsp. mobilis (strain ATCC 31821 / ZM4 / CP4) TaxID=264203 RepID=A0A806CE13_ZYMMO|nr:hypothetical protein [Zymomonas mobilis]ADC33885.1 hypothetical protein ZZM4_0116 [Zymomonas mobilis subsp. mobilis ZM4 = ATCC 31821]AHB11119.1 hypothetical protein ZCP4_1863 [Zymomonas mobilis subsp. mobilis str. CP4 = NRRL B-14023]AHJ71456.1 hypothetical protein A254_01871 [Zymomonas mobilis subsp. mobilis NRRL B-12526]